MSKDSMLLSEHLELSAVHWDLSSSSYCTTGPYRSLYPWC